MSSLQDCCAPCPQVQTVNVPGVAGDTGADGTDGSNGVNAYTVVGTGGFNVPLVANTNVTIPVGNSTWMVVGQNVIVEGPANFEVVSIPSPSTVELEWLDYTNDVAAGTAIAAGVGVSPAGLIGVSSINDPLLIANGGTSSATKGAAQLALGLGQTIVKQDNDALGYAITNALGSVGLSVVATAAGLWLIKARVTVDYVGVTFVASRTLTIQVWNVTTASALASSTRRTGIQSASSALPSFDYVADFEVATLALNDTIQIRVMLDTVQSAGTSTVTSGSLAIVPLALS